MNRRRMLTVAVAVAVVATIAGWTLVRWSRGRGAEAAGARGMAHHANLQYEEAIAEYRRAEQLAPNEWRWTYYRALVHAERGDAPLAADAFRRVVAAQPDHGFSWWRLGEAEFKQGHFREADAAYARAESHADVSDHARRGRTRVATARGGMPTAPQPAGAPLRAYTPPRDPMVDALADISQSIVFLLRHAAAISLASDPARREQIVRRALDVDPRNPDVVYELASLLQQLRRSSEALTYFARHLDMAEDDQQTLVQMGKCYSDLGDTAKAEELLRRALRISDDGVGWFNLGVVMEQRGQVSDAEACYRRAVAVDPNHASSHNNLAAILAERGELPAAVSHFRTVVRMDPAHVDAHANLGAALAQQGQFEEAIRYLDEALNLNPNHRNARANRDAIVKARTRVTPQKR